MSRFRVRGAVRPLVGEVTVPGDKSIGHRAVILAALGSGRAMVRGLSGGEDNRRTVAAFRALGVAISGEESGALGVEGVGLGGLREAARALDCGNSGTTMRLLAGVLVAQPFPSTLVGDRYLESRPMARIAGPLAAMGGRVEGRRRRGELCAPLTVGPAPSRLRGIEFRSPTASAQVKSALLLAGLWADGATSVIEPALSRDHTERMLQSLGVPLTVDGPRVTIDPTGWERRLPARDWSVPGDLSSAAFLLAAAIVVPGSVVTVRGVGVNPTRTGVLDVLGAMGAAITVAGLRDEGGEPVADLTARGSQLEGTEVAGELAVRAIDELPLVAVLAAHARGRTVIRDAGELRVKESDRIAAMAAALAAIGVTVEERRDGLVIEGGRVRGGEVASRGDHRIAMAAAVAALGGEGVFSIADTDNVATSFPGFVATLRSLGAEIDE
ncbi:MAG: 3-phosphoshikimate 1-carboxyvinyltransferase [Myxococcales bacterium]|nr:3-phosphoshikimate 1-carboxyvinyltransferase [Myxococcales bacterium]